MFDELFRSRRFEDDLHEELRSSFEILVDQFVATGMNEAEARRAARLEFGGLEQVKDDVRDGLWGAAFHTLAHDVRYAVRALGRNRSFALVAVLTLGLGIGVNTAIFSIFYAVLLRPLPFDKPEQLVVIWGSLREAGSARAVISGPMLGEIEHRNRSLAGVAGIWVTSATLAGDTPEQIKAALVTTNFFDVLGARASLGRTFTRTDDRTPALVLTDPLFRRRYGGHPGLVGHSVRAAFFGSLAEATAATVAGVLPAAFELRFAPDANIPADVQAFTPFPFDIYRDRRTLYYIRTIARLKPGVSLVAAQEDLERVAAELRGAFTEYADANVHLEVVGMQADAFGDVRQGLTALLAGGAFILMICCANVAALMLARASDQRRQIALRLSLGASRWRIVRQLLAEGGVLAMMGGLTGVALAWAVFRVLLAIRPERLARAGDAALNLPVLGFAAAVTMTAGILFGLVPALDSLDSSLIEHLRCGRRGWLGRSHRRSGAALVIIEITLGFVLVTCAGLTARSLLNIERVRAGFDPEHLLTFQVAFGSTLSPDIRLETIREWETAFAALPGATRVGATSHLPLDDLPNWYGDYRPDGKRIQGLTADYRSVTPGYLSAMGTRLLEGRDFDAQDKAGGRLVVIVDDLLARTTWPGQSAIGKELDASHVARGGLALAPSVVVGVVEHVRNHSLTKQLRGEIYVPFEQSPRSPLTFVLRTGADPLALVPAIRNMLSQRALAMTRVRSMDQYIDRDVAPARFTAVLASVFAALALLLAATGIFGVLDYQVSRRLPEMGVRMALGARAADVLRMVLREALGLTAAAVLLGAAISLAATRLLETVIYQVAGNDPPSYALALLLLPAAALFGCWRPARRAASANMAELIREE